MKIDRNLRRPLRRRPRLSRGSDVVLGLDYNEDLMQRLAAASDAGRDIAPEEIRRRYLLQ